MNVIKIGRMQENECLGLKKEEENDQNPEGKCARYLLEILLEKLYNSFVLNLMVSS